MTGQVQHRGQTVKEHYVNITESRKIQDNFFSLLKATEEQDPGS
jgi:hypothetical protein